jgi:hypothetical protein
MSNNGTFTKILAIIGTVLVWFVLLAPVLLTAFAYLRGGVFLFDYLMPAELFPLALGGGLLLLWAMIRARSRRAVIGGGLGASIVLLVGGQALAVATGLASGATEPTGWPWALVICSLIGFILALVTVGVGGILLLMDLYSSKKES